MKYIEILDWILDNDDKKIVDEEKYRQNIEFVHSLGLKCDCVGWSTLKLSDSRADEILSAIDTFCKKNGWKARGIYTRTYVNYESDWYELIPTAFKDNTLCDHDDECESEQGDKVRVYNIRAYHEMKPSPKWFYQSVLVPERFRNSCVRHNISDVDFCWAKDIGKYEAEQYFHLYGNKQIQSIVVDRGIKISDRKRIEAAGGYLPKITSIFYNLQQINLQDCYIETDMPKCSIAHAYSPRRNNGRTTFLIHKDFADVLLREKAISPSALRLAMIVKDVLPGYVLEKTEIMDRPISSCLDQRIAEYEKIKSTPRPARSVSEKDALKIFRSTKKERKEDFRKSLSKAVATSILETSYAPLAPYYLIADGGYLSDEYELLSYDEANAENAYFIEELRAEELLDDKPNGVVFAKCPDGDRILLCENGNVIRFSHEEPTVIEEWVSLAQFFVDTINE